MSRKFVLLLLVAALAMLWWLRPSDAGRVGQVEGVAPVAAGPGTLVVDLQDGMAASDVEALGRQLGVRFVLSSPVSEDEALYRAEVADMPTTLRALEGLSVVEAAEPLMEMEAFGWPDDPDYSKQWNMQMIGQPLPWRAGRGAGVKVAVLDTGVSIVEDLKGVDVATGRSFVPGEPTSADGHGHGTHVAGTIAQATNNGLGVTGIAPEATILPYKVLSSRGMGSHDWIAAGIDQAVDDGADVINMSLGGAYSKVIEVAVNKAVAAGVVVVAAAGNTGRRGIGCPACLRPVIAVSAVGPDGGITRYSSYGKGVEIAAPGGDTRIKDGGILQDTIDGKGGHAYRAFQGTSMASPHVAGAVAVLIGMGLSGDAAVDTLLRTAVTQTPGVVTEQYGHGRLDLRAAVTDVLLRKRGAVFGMAAAIAFVLTLMAALPTGGALVAAVSAGVTAGGVFFLPWLPLGPGLATDMLSGGLLDWPSALGSPAWAHFPLWSSALLPLALAFVLGWSRAFGLVVAGVCAGLGFSLLHGAFSGTIDLTLMGPSLEWTWLVFNGAVSLVAAMAVVGVQRIRRGQA